MIRALVLNRIVSALLVGLVNLANTIPAMQACNMENIIIKLTVHIPSQDNFPLGAILAATDRIRCCGRNQWGHIIIIYIHVLLYKCIFKACYKLSHTWASCANA